MAISCGKFDREQARVFAGQAIYSWFHYLYNILCVVGSSQCKLAVELSFLEGNRVPYDGMLAEGHSSLVFSDPSHT